MSLVVQLQFDGSFRPPKDPGYPVLSRRLATCAASIGIIHTHHASDEKQNHEEESNVIPFAVGARWLPVIHDMTSAHTEYEGALFGLRYLARHLDDIIDSESKDDHCHLIIQGDCKAVIDQLAGRSVPRRLQSIHQQAQLELENHIKPAFDNVVFDHIPRSSNVRCDQLCNTLHDGIITQEVEERCWNNVLQSMNTDREGGDDLEHSRLKTIIEDHLQSPSSLIRHSMRPAFYVQIAHLAQLSEDFHLLEQVGRLLWDESKRHLSSSKNSNNRQEGCDDKQKQRTVLVNAVNYQIQAWIGLGDLRKATALQRKHRVLLQSSTPSPTSSRNQLSMPTTPTMLLDSRDSSVIVDDDTSTKHESYCSHQKRYEDQEQQGWSAKLDAWKREAKSTSWDTGVDLWI